MKFIIRASADIIFERIMKMPEITNLELHATGWRCDVKTKSGTWGIMRDTLAQLHNQAKDCIERM